MTGAAKIGVAIPSPEIRRFPNALFFEALSKLINSILRGSFVCRTHDLILFRVFVGGGQ